MDSTLLSWCSWSLVIRSGTWNDPEPSGERRRGAPQSPRHSRPRPGAGRRGAALRAPAHGAPRTGAHCARRPTPRTRHVALTRKAKYRIAFLQARGLSEPVERARTRAQTTLPAIPHLPFLHAVRSQAQRRPRGAVSLLAHLLEGVIVHTAAVKHTHRAALRINIGALKGAGRRWVEGRSESAAEQGTGIRSESYAASKGTPQQPCRARVR